MLAQLEQKLELDIKYLTVSSHVDINIIKVEKFTNE